MSTLPGRLLAQADPAGGGSFWLPPEASHAAGVSDAVFYFIYGVSAFFFCLIVALMIYFIIRYRQRRAGDPALSQVSHHTGLEITWSAIPLILVVLMFLMGFRGFLGVVTPERNALHIRVTGQKWVWAFKYPSGHVDSELHLPVGTPVRLTLESADVIHSLWIPAFRIKRDAVPGRYNQMAVTATTPGEYLAVCAEYCGTNHSNMVARVVVHPSGEYEKWLAEASDLFRTRSPVEVGAFLVKNRCGGCHSVDGKANVGPTLKGIYEHPVQLADGQTVTADDNYLRESIVDPRAKVVKGYEPLMPTFKGQLKDREITAIIDYIKELSQEDAK
ncbi:MAG: cytochrome c oxidase subunit II [Planctomycetota bacterium]